MAQDDDAIVVIIGIVMIFISIFAMTMLITSVVVHMTIIFMLTVHAPTWAQEVALEGSNADGDDYCRSEFSQHDSNQSHTKWKVALIHRGAGSGAWESRC